MDTLGIQRQLRLLSDRLERLEKPDVPGAPATWTPAFQGSTIGGTLTYSVQSGCYTRIGNRVIASGRLNVSVVTVAPTGNLRITGLPITAAGGDGAMIYAYAGLFNLSAVGNILGGWIISGNTRIDLTESADNAAAAFLPAGALQVGTDLIFTAFYQVE